MINRLALLGAFFATLSLAYPTVAAAQNPWRANPQASGQYYDQPQAKSAPAMPTAKLPKYAPLDGNLESESSQTYGYPGGYPGGVPGGAPGAYPGGLISPYGNGAGLGAPGYGVLPGYGGLGLAPGYGASPYLGGLGYPGLGTPYLGTPGLGGYSPGFGWGNTPTSIMPFW